MVEAMDCQHCDRPASRRCSDCKTTYYCSVECQKKSWPNHIFHCRPRNRPIKPAYHLCRAAYGDRLPEDPKTREIFGFTRVHTATERSFLLGLYHGLIARLEVSPDQLHEWQVGGRLVQEIKAAFETLPVNNRGAYYPWFLQNQYVLDHTLPNPSGDFKTNLSMRGWSFIGYPATDSLQTIEAVQASWPTHKQVCFAFYCLALAGYNPSANQDTYVTLGFCTCFADKEGPLLACYRTLMDRCTFDEFCEAYLMDSLVPLFESLRRQLRDFDHLGEFLQQQPMINSVWNLKAFVQLEDTDRPIQPVEVDYGFMNCKTTQERLDLKNVYKQVLIGRYANALSLHEACVKGKLFEHVGGLVKLTERFRQLMKNPYPLPDIPDIG